MSKKTTNLTIPEAPKEPQGQDEYLPTVDTPVVLAAQRGAGGAAGTNVAPEVPASLPPYEAMGVSPAAVLSFAVRDGFWVVVTTNGQKHRHPYPVDG